MVVCLTSIRFNMKADILRQGYVSGTDFNKTDSIGEWVNQQDPESGDIFRVWQPNQAQSPSTPPELVLETFACEARGIVNAGIRATGSTERFGDRYEDVDYVKLTFPASVKISQRDRVTNIRDSKNNIIWFEREEPEAAPTIYEVTGITPIIDPFGKHIESFSLLKRADRQV